MEASSSYNMASAEGEVLLEAIELAQELQAALQQPPASSLCNSTPCLASFSRVQSVLQDFKQAEDSRPDSISWGEHGGSVLEQLVDALHGGLERLQQAAAFSRVRAYLSTEGLVAAFASACGNCGTCLQGLLRLPNVPQSLRDQTLAVSRQLEQTPLSLEPAQQLMLAELRKSNDLLWNGLIPEADCHFRMDSLVSKVFPEGFDIAELRATISDLARGAGQENQQKEHREGHLLMQVSRVLQRRLQLATASSTHSFLSTGSQSLASEASSFSPEPPPKEFICPISGDLMADPVLLTETGMTFDRASIQEWLNRGNQTCPLTHQRLTTGQMVSNFSLKALIEAWATEHHVLLPHPSSSVTVTRQSTSLPAGFQSTVFRPARPSSMDSPALRRLQNQPMPSAFTSADALADAPGTPPQTVDPVSVATAPRFTAQEDDDRTPQGFTHVRRPAAARAAFISTFGADTIPEGDGDMVNAAPDIRQSRSRCPVSAFAESEANSADQTSAVLMSPMHVNGQMSSSQMLYQFPGHQPQGPPSFQTRATDSALPASGLPPSLSPHSTSMPANPGYLPQVQHAPGAAALDSPGSAAVRTGQEEAESYTVQRPIGLRFQESRVADVSQNKVLWEAALAGSSRDVLVAIRKGGNLEWHNTCGKTPLLCAAAAGHPAIVQILLEQGVDRKARDLTEESVLHHAASQARLSVLKTLLSFNDPAVLELLSCQNSVGDTPLHCAASIGSTSCVRTLLESSGPGASEVKNHLGRTPVHVAAQQGHSAVVLALLQAGAKHSATDDGGLTPLHTACCSGDAGTVSVLVKAGANRDAWDVLDRQPIDVIGCHRGGEDNQQAQDAIVALLKGSAGNLDLEMEQRKSFCSAASDTTQERMEGDVSGPSPAGIQSMERRPSDTNSADSGSRTRSGVGDAGLQLPPLPPIKKQRLDRALRPLVEPGSKQTQLDLSWQGLDKDDTKAVAIMLLHNRSITSLDYHGNKPSRRGIKHLCQAMEHNRVLTSITLGDSEIDYDGASLIAQTLSSCWLTHLNLWNARLGNENARPILHALHSNTRLLSLDLGCNELGPEVGNMVAAMLRNNGTLQTLDLRTNRLGKTGITAVAEGCIQNSSLQELLLNNNGMPMFGLNNAKGIFKARKAAVNLRVKWS